MDAKKTIRKYIARGAWVTITGLVALAACVLGILLSVIGLDENAIFASMGVLSFPVALIFLAIGLPSYLQANKSLKQLEAKGLLEKAAAEMSSPSAQVIGKNKGMLTENFLFCKGTGIAVAYKDILWTYKHRLTRSLLFIPIQVIDSLMISTADRNGVQAINMGGKDKQDALKGVILEIYKHNPKVLVGFSKENQKAYKELRKQKV